MRTSSLLLLGLVGCAQGAIHQGIDLGNGDQADAAESRDAPSRPDAPAQADAPARTDAPAASCATPFSGVLATWSFAGDAGSQTTTPAASSATGLTAGNFGRAPTLTPAAGSGSINSSTWSMSAQLDTTTYYTVSITPPAGCSLGVTSASLDTKASATGPASASIATDADNFMQTSAVPLNAVSTPALSVSAMAAPVEIRIYGWNASSTNGTFRVQNTFSLTGTLQ